MSLNNKSKRFQVNPAMLQALGVPMIGGRYRLFDHHTDHALRTALRHFAGAEVVGLLERYRRALKLVWGLQTLTLDAALDALCEPGSPAVTTLVAVLTQVSKEVEDRHRMDMARLTSKKIKNV